MINQGLLPLKSNITVETEHQPDVNLGQKAKTERQALNPKAELSSLAFWALLPSLLPLNLNINIFLQE